MTCKKEALLFAIVAWGLSCFNPPVQAQSSTPGVIFSDFGQNMSISSTTGWCVSGAGTTGCGPQLPRWVASPFVAESTAALSQIKLALGYNGGTNGAFIELVSDGNGVPGSTILESWTASNLSSSNTPLLSLNSVARPILQGGATYWLIAMGSASDSLVFWWDSVAGSGSIESEDDGISWFSLGGFTAFEVLGGVTLLDPVPGLLNGPAVATAVGTPLYAVSLGRPVQGVSADGVTEVVVQIPAAKIGDQFMLTLLNDNNSQSNSTDEDGALGVLGSSLLSTSPITATAVDADSGPTAFVIYRAPIDFARSILTNDGSAAKRSVSIKISDLSTNITTTTPIQIVRPPVALIHGLWSEPAVWRENGFEAALNTPNKIFNLYEIDYESTHSGSVDSNMTLSLSQLKKYLQAFKTDTSVAAVQFDVVGHSMGGLIAKDLASDTRSKEDNTFGQGYVHKLITIDTPFKGSSWAANLSAASDKCKSFFADASMPAVPGGATTDLTPNSFLLIKLRLPPLPPTHAIVGTITSSQDTAGSNILTPLLPVFDCSSLFPGSFSALFNGPNDFIVSQESQEFGFSVPTTATEVPGVSHLHFLPLPWLLQWVLPPVGALDAVSGNPQVVIGLLNTPVTEPSFLRLP